MARNRLIFLFLFFFGSSALASGPNCAVLFGRANEPLQVRIWDLYANGSREEADHLRSQVEFVLKNAKIVKVLHDYNSTQGATKVLLEGGLIAIRKQKGIFTRMVDRPQKVLANGETAAYEIDKAIENNEVAITVDRVDNGEEISLQLFVEGEEQEGLVNFPDSLSFFDTLIKNYDRHAGNYKHVNGYIVAFDNGAMGNIAPDISFTKRVKVLVRSFLSREIDKQRLLLELSFLLPERRVYNRLARTSEEDWIHILGPKINPRQLNAFLKNRARLISTIEKLRLLYGDGIFRAGPSSHLIEYELVPQGPKGATDFFEEMTSWE